MSQKRIDEILGAAANSDEDEELPAVTKKVVSSGDPEKDLKDDYDVIRNGIHNLIEKGGELVDSANYFAKEKQDARSVEAASMAQKEARENLMALLNMHKVKKEIEGVAAPKQAGDTNINNAVFVGTTGDLLKLTKEMNSGVLVDALKTIDVEPEVKALNTGSDTNQEITVIDAKSK